jgi:hypothetical protein
MPKKKPPNGTPQMQGWTQLWPHPMHLILGMPLTLRLLPYTLSGCFFAAMEQVESSKIYAGVNNLKDQLVCNRDKKIIVSFFCLCRNLNT